MDYELEENAIDKKSQTGGSSKKRYPLSILHYQLKLLSILNYPLKKHEGWEAAQR